MRIDIHQHYLPHAPSFHDEAAQQWLHYQSHVQAYADVDTIVQALDAAQIDMAVLQGEYYVHQHNCVERNQAVIAACARAPQRLKAFAIVQPRHPHACDEIARCLDAGMWGVGELNPALQQFSLRERAVQRVFEYCAQHGVPILMHVNEPVGRAYPGKSDTGLVTFYEIAARYPELRLILAHWGGGLLWYEAMPTVRRVLTNVYYDTAASPLIFPNTHQIVQMAKLTAPHKIVFGSDFPLRLQPSHAAAIAPFAQQLTEALADVSLEQAWFGATAQQLVQRQGHPTPARAAVFPIDAHTGVVLLVECYPATQVLLAQYGMYVDEYTPWWQSLLTMATASGVTPERLAKLLIELRQVVAHP